MRAEEGPPTDHRTDSLSQFLTPAQCLRYKGAQALRDALRGKGMDSLIQVPPPWLNLDRAPP